MMGLDEIFQRKAGVNPLIDIPELYFNIFRISYLLSQIDEKIISKEKIQESNHFALENVRNKFPNLDIGLDEKKESERKD